jgi:hypothetical protein
VAPFKNLTDSFGGIRAMNLDFSRLRRSDRIIGGGAIALFVFMFFFSWYGVSANVPSLAGVNLNVSRSGWDTFTNSRWIWLVTIIVALAAVVLVAIQRRLELPIPAGALVAGLGALSTLLIFYRIVHHPTASASFGGFHASAGIKIGIWLGLISAAAIAYGGYLALQEEGGLTVPTRERPGAAFSGLLAASGPSPASASAPPGGAVAPPVPPPIPPPAAPPTPPGGTGAPGSEA